MAGRRLIESEWYRQRWGERFSLTSDQNVKSWYENDKRGFRTATTVGSSVVGKKGDILLCDDPMDAKKVSSAVYRAGIKEWWGKGFFNRVNHPMTGRRVVIGQRTHVDDLQGYLLATGTWEHLNIPEEFEPSDRTTTKIGWTDWRTERGQWLRPERFGPDQANEFKALNGTVGYSGQYLQKPMPDGGTMFQRAWFADRYVDAEPSGLRLCRYWDLAATAPKLGTDPDWTVGALVGRDPSTGNCYIIDIRRMRSTPLDVERAIRAAADQNGKGVAIRMEQEPGSSGVITIDYYARKVLQGFDFAGIRSTGPKEERARPLSGNCEMGRVFIVRGKWNAAFLDELEQFPNGNHDDQVDAVSGAFSFVTEAQLKLAIAIG